MATRDEILRFVIQTEGSDDLKSTAKSIDAVTAAAAAGEPKAQALVDELSKLSEASGAINSLGRLKIELAQTGTALGNAKRQLDNLNAEFGEAGPKTAAATKALAKAAGEVDRLAKRERELEVAVQKAQGTIEKHGYSIRELGAAQADVAARAQRAAAGVTSYASAAKDSATASDKAAAGASKAGKAFDSMRNGINNAVRSLLQVTGVAGAVSAALSTIGVGRLFGGAIDSATDFEAKLSSIRAVSGASSEQLARMKRAAEDATKSTKFSASEAADALGELARASGDADAAIAQLAPTLNLAQAAGIGTAESATILTTTLTQFGLSADQAGRAADVFAREANSTNDTVSQLGNAMSYVAPLARQLGLTLEQTTAVLGALAQEGFKGERAGTALRNVFSQLLDPSSKFREELRGLGITSTDFTQIITKLAAAGDRSKRAILALDSEARPAIQALVTSGGANINRLIDDFQNVNGEAEKTARTMGENFAGATSRLRSAFDQLRRALIEPILDPLRTQFDDVAKRIRAFVDTAEFQRIVAAVKQFALEATDALIALGRGVDYEALSQKIRNFAGEASTFFKDLKENVQGVLSAISIAGSTISTIFNGIQTVILGAATAVVGAMSVFVRSIRSAVDAMKALPGGAEALAGVSEKLTEVIGGLDAVATEFAKRTAKNAGETADAFNNLAGAMDGVESASSKSADAVSKVGDAAASAAPSIKQVGNELGLIPDYTGPAANAVENLRGPIQEVGRDSLLTAQHITKFSDAALKLGGGPLADAARKVREADAALSALNRSATATPYELQKAEIAVRQARAEFEKVKESAGRAKEGTDDLKGSFSDLGIQSQTALQEAAEKARIAFEKIRASSGQTQQGLIDTRNAFIAYAEKAIEAVAQADDATKRNTENMLRGVAAQIGALDKLKAKLADTGASANLFKPPTDGLRQMGSAASATATQVQSIGEASSESGQKTDQFAARGQDALGALTTQIANVRSEFAALSQTAAEAFDTAFQNAGRAFTSVGVDLGFAAIRSALKTAQEEVQQSVDKQRDALASLTASLTQYAQTGESAFRGVAESAQFSTAGLDSLTVAIQSGTGSFDLLGRQELGPLQAAIDAARAKTEALQRQAEQATQSLIDMARSTQDEIDQLRGNQDAIEQRRHEERLRQIRDEAALAGAEGSAAASEAIAKENELHSIRMANIAKERAERDKSSSTETPRPSQSQSQQSSGQGGGGGGIVNNWNFNGLVLTGTQEQVADQLARITAPALRRLSSRGGG